jgi:hypothetical protein
MNAGEYGKMARCGSTAVVVLTCVRISSHGEHRIQGDARLRRMTERERLKNTIGRLSWWLLLL